MEKYYKIFDIKNLENCDQEKLKKIYNQKIKETISKYEKYKNDDINEIDIAYKNLIKKLESKTSKNSSNTFSQNINYWLKIIFKNNIPHHFKSSCEPTGIFGPPYN